MIFLDFDGTLVDLWPRYCAVFNDIMGLSLPLQTYKRMKQGCQRDSLLAARVGRELPENYFAEKAKRLEDEAYLDMDRLLFPPDTINGFLSAGCQILSKRKYPESLYRQMERLGIEGKGIVVKGSKREWVERSCFRRGVIFGDSLADLEVAGIDAFQAYMVDYGLNTKEQFDAAGIDYILLHGREDMIHTLQDCIAKEDDKCDTH